MDGLSANLLLAAGGVAFLHTLLGPDHYLPFLMMARARNWGWVKTLVIAGCCGLAHVLGSIAVGMIGLSLGYAVSQIESVELSRGDWAAWALVAFGLGYGAWGVRIALRASKGLQPHEHGGHVHMHISGNQPHDHSAKGAHKSVTFWTLMVVFVLGPCEPLIPLFLIPASRNRWELALAAAIVFGVVTIVTMLIVTAIGLLGIKRLPLGSLEKWVHAMAGAMVAASGGAVIAFGL